MTRRKKEPTLVDVAMKAPWQLSAALSAAALVGAFVAIPMVAGTHPLLVALAPVGRIALLVFAVIFGFIALLRSFAREHDSVKTDHVVERSSTFWEERRKAQRRLPAVDVDYEELDRRAQRESAAPKPDRWSLELLQSLDWKRFEEVVAAYFREHHFRCETVAYGPDGGVDVRLFFREEPMPVGIVQCKAWGARPVGVAPVRELLGVMAHENVRRGYFAATGEFTEDAIAFAGANPVKLITGSDFLTAIAKMDPARSAHLLAVSTEGDYTVPTCASCGKKLYLKTFGNGGTAWVCRGFPKCRTRIWAKAS